jgi:purine-cytosine permease-like protein
MGLALFINLIFEPEYASYAKIDRCWSLSLAQSLAPTLFLSLQMAKHPIEKARRQYNHWVATETLEDYSLRYSPSSFRKWSPLLLANTALGSISFLALEAIGAVLLLSFGYTNAIAAITLASLIILLAGIPISYQAARHNIDIDLLTRSAGFGYIGSTITSLIYATFCFIFFALEAAIMAQALELYFQLPLSLGYILCSLIIIPIVYYGITAINRLHQLTQPLWLILMLIPFYFVLTREPRALELLTLYQGSLSGSNKFDPYYFGMATGISFSLIAQIGEQVDYLRFMPEKHKDNRFRWWFSLLAAGP